MKKNIVKKIIFFLLLISYSQNSLSQRHYWQQRVDYKMDIDFNVNTHQFTGSQHLTYYNNSQDTITRVFFHLYFNAFQPGSMMDVRNRQLEDSDKRVKGRIQKLSADEIGFHKITSLKQNNTPLSYVIQGTVMEVELNTPLLPSQSTVFAMDFFSQVPIQIRRSGRNSAEGIDYSMAQWYPKIAEYDEDGWHAEPYVGREFYAPWGDFEVNLSIEDSYTVASTGELMNPKDVGHGYVLDPIKKRKKKDKLVWKFVAKNVHDFVWAADRDYQHLITQVPDGPTLHFFYQENDKTQAWKELPQYAIETFEIMKDKVGKYPYKQYSIIQGGDGGMEYPMATLITGNRELKSLVGVTVHEAIHSWFQGALATNESLYAWMDEGFTTYFSDEVISKIFPQEKPSQQSNFKTYNYLATSGKEEPLSTHADHFMTNFGYGLGSYYKGAIALAQLQYIVGKEVFNKAVKRYFSEWKFKHPTSKDFIRIFEKESGMSLDWYLNYWINTTHSIDYAIDTVESMVGKTKITLSRKGMIPMPIDIHVTYKDGRKKIFYTPLSIMRGEKKDFDGVEYVILPDWTWTNPQYFVDLEEDLTNIATIEIDASGYLADIDRSNNTWKEQKE